MDSCSKNMMCSCGQGFAKNYNPFYVSNGLLGHTGIDVSCGYGSDITSPYEGYVFKTLTKEAPAADGSGFTGVFILVNDGIECFEWLVGHCDPAVSLHTWVNKGQKIGTEANHGKVYSGNVEITVAMQRAGDTRGTHRHYQKRPLIPRHHTEPNKAYIGGQYVNPFYHSGRFYEIPHYNNGYNGCIDPTRPLFERDLFVGRSGYDVFVLQRILVRAKCLSVEPTGYFGLATFTALQRYQKMKGIIMTGYMGAKTRVVVLGELEKPFDPLKA